MVFSSLLFLFRFLPAVLVLYFLVPPVGRNFVLLIVSLFFYAWGEPVYIILMLVSILSSYLGGFLVDRLVERGHERGARVALVLSLAVGLGLLGYFKYADFAVRTVNDITGSSFALPHVALPIGISFYTFQTLSYVIDVYRGAARVQKNPVSYGAYVAMFPQLIAGPIVQYKTIDEQLRHRRESAVMFADGVHRFVIGLGKKVLLANSAGALWDYIKVMDAQRIPALMAWLGLAAFTFQIYFDFSAYSDMAIGLGKMFGFTFLENFNYPYLSRSVTEFWRRWHISLGTWFREYVYIPLGGNRVSLLKHIRNILVVWLLTGIWHGANWNFLLWGLYYAVILLIEKLWLGKYLKKIPGILSRIYCIILVMIGWYIFSFNEIASGTGFFKALFGLAGNGFAGGETLYLLLGNLILLCLLAIGSTRIPARLGARVMARIGGRDFLSVLVRGIFYAAVFILSTAYLVDASFNPFLYFRF